ncbi:MAG: hypothetical protein HY744_22945 [Deltaproteobacteria bacterium]|nr:hypothetical protein [Deltaproteobacteria bacterium]
MIATTKPTRPSTKPTRFRIILGILSVLAAGGIGYAGHAHFKVIKPLGAAFPTMPEVALAKAVLPMVCPAARLAQFAERRVSLADATQAYRAYRMDALQLHKLALQLPKHEDSRDLRARIIEAAAFANQVGVLDLLRRPGQVAAELRRRLNAVQHEVDLYVDAVPAKRAQNEGNPGLALLLVVLRNAPDLVGEAALADLLLQPGVRAVLEDIKPPLEEALGCVEALCLSGHPGDYCPAASMLLVQLLLTEFARTPLWRSARTEVKVLQRIRDMLAAPKVKAEPVTFKKQMIAKGAVREETQQDWIHCQLSGPNGEVTVGFEHDGVVRTEILDVEGDVITKMKVTYERDCEVQRWSGRSAEKRCPLQGKSFVLQATASDFDVTDADGKPVSGELSKDVRQDYSRFGKPERTHQNLPETEIEPGQRVPGLETALKLESADAYADGEEPHVSVSNVKVVLKGTETAYRQKIAVIESTFDLSVSYEDVRMVFHAQGHLRLRVADGQKIGEEYFAKSDVMGQELRMHVVGKCRIFGREAGRMISQR